MSIREKQFGDEYHRSTQFEWNENNRIESGYGGKKSLVGRNSILSKPFLNPIMVEKGSDQVNERSAFVPQERDFLHGSYFSGPKYKNSRKTFRAQPLVDVEFKFLLNEKNQNEEDSENNSESTSSNNSFENELENESVNEYQTVRSNFPKLHHRQKKLIRNMKSKVRGNPLSKEEVDHMLFDWHQKTDFISDPKLDESKRGPKPLVNLKELQDQRILEEEKTFIEQNLMHNRQDFINGKKNVYLDHFRKTKTPNRLPDTARPFIPTLPSTNYALENGVWPENLPEKNKGDKKNRIPMSNPLPLKDIMETQRRKYGIDLTELSNEQNHQNLVPSKSIRFGQKKIHSISRENERGNLDQETLIAEERFKKIPSSFNHPKNIQSHQENMEEINMDYNNHLYDLKNPQNIQWHRKSTPIFGQKKEMEESNIDPVISKDYHQPPPTILRRQNRSARNNDQIISEWDSHIVNEKQNHPIHRQPTSQNRNSKISAQQVVEINHPLNEPFYRSNLRNRSSHLRQYILDQEKNYTQENDIWMDPIPQTNPSFIKSSIYKHPFSSTQKDISSGMDTTIQQNSSNILRSLKNKHLLHANPIKEEEVNLDPIFVGDNHSQHRNYRRNEKRLEMDEKDIDEVDLSIVSKEKIPPLLKQTKILSSPNKIIDEGEIYTPISKENLSLPHKNWKNRFQPKSQPTFFENEENANEKIPENMYRKKIVQKSIDKKLVEELNDVMDEPPSPIEINHRWKKKNPNLSKDLSTSTQNDLEKETLPTNSKINIKIRNKTRNPIQLQDEEINQQQEMISRQYPQQQRQKSSLIRNQQNLSSELTEEGEIHLINGLRIPTEKWTQWMSRPRIQNLLKKWELIPEDLIDPNSSTNSIPFTQKVWKQNTRPVSETVNHQYLDDTRPENESRTVPHLVDTKQRHIFEKNAIHKQSIQPSFDQEKSTPIQQPSEKIMRKKNEPKLVPIHAVPDQERDPDKAMKINERAMKHKTQKSKKD